VCCFGYDPALPRGLREHQWVCRVGDDLFAGLDRDGVHFLTRETWSAKVAAKNGHEVPQFLAYI